MTTLRKSDISRTLGRILGKGQRSAANGWDVRDDLAGAPYITLNHFDQRDDRAALDKITAHYGARYTITYTPVLADYDYLPDDYKHCAVIELRPITQETPAMTDTTPTVTVTLPGAFCDYFEGTGVGQGQTYDDAELIAAKEAFDNGTIRRYGRDAYTLKITTGNLTVINVFEEYTEYCLDANSDDPDPKEVKAAKEAAKRLQEARRTLKTAQAQQGPQEPPSAQQGPQETATAPLADWERETLAAAHTAPTTPREPSADLNIAQGDPQEPAHAPTSVWVTTQGGERIEYAHIPNGDPARIEHFLTEARTVPTFTNISTEEHPDAPAPADTPVLGEGDPYPAHNTMGLCAHGYTCRYHRPDPTLSGVWIHPADRTPCTATSPNIHVTWTDTFRGHHHATITLPGGARAKITYAPHGTQYTHIGAAGMGTGAPTVARANSLPDLITQYARMSGYQDARIEEYGTPGHPARNSA
ncbi:hypothetical protein AB0E08_07485 [Streptomyces sp. NPDC048281]|uniref:hypothetical protein n=1 Tax=Streptomyces sp. NPDC048281 TaxID=3154715 RepID=UPI00344A38D4